jgi:hypothetical protein
MVTWVALALSSVRLLRELFGLSASSLASSWSPVAEVRVLPNLFVGWASTAPLMMLAAAAAFPGHRLGALRRQWMFLPLLSVTSQRPMVVQRRWCISVVCRALDLAAFINV